MTKTPDPVSLLGKIASAGQNGQFRTPRHIIQLMVEMTAPQATDLICDPACGTAGFLVAVGEYLRQHHPNLLLTTKLREHFHHHMFHGFDFDNTMLRIGSMNMLLHGVENPDIRYRDSLAQEHAAAGGDEDASRSRCDPQATHEQSANPGRSGRVGTDAGRKRRRRRRHH